jgi:hypothetical protein
MPKLPPEDLDEMNAGIKQGELPVRYEDPFGDGDED